jgi:hypothetical protein
MMHSVVLRRPTQPSVPELKRSAPPEPRQSGSRHERSVKRADATVAAKAIVKMEESMVIMLMAFGGWIVCLISEQMRGR